MLQEILTHTPIWVWALLAFLISRGVQASRDREIALSKMLILPAILCIFSVQGMIASFGVQLALLGVWACASLFGLILAWRMQNNKNMRMLSPQTVHLPGSWLPLILMMSIFTLKYLQNILLAIQPGLHEAPLFMLVCGAISGVMSGLMLGKAFKALQLWRGYPLSSLA